MADEAVQETKQESKAPSADIIAELKTRVDSTAEELAKLRADDARRVAEAEAKKKKKEQDHKVDSGQAKEEIEALNKQLEAQAAELQSLREAQKKRIEELMNHFPEDKKKTLAKWGEKLSLSDYEEFVREQLANSAAPTEQAAPQRANPPPPATATGMSKLNPGMRKLQPETYRILEDAGYDPKFGEEIEEREGVFGHSGHNFVKRLRAKARQGARMTREAADERFRR